MAKLKRLTFLLSINILLQYADCKREKRGVSDFFIPGINVGDILLEQFKILVFGSPVDKEQIILDRQMEHMETTREILSLTQQISGALENTPETTIMIQSLQKFPSHLDSIDESFREFEMLEGSGKNASDFQVRQYAQNSINRYIGPMKDITSIYSLVVPRLRGRSSKSDFTLLPLVARQMKGFKKLCDLFKSQQQIGQSYLLSITLAEIKAFAIMEYSLRKLSEVHSLNYNDEKRKLKNNLKRRLQQLTSAFQPIMKTMNREVWRCEPEEYIEDETYFKMTVFQMYIAREEDLRGSPDNCYYPCNHFKESFHYKCTHFDGYSDPDVNYLEYPVCETVRMCAGSLYNCYSKFTNGIDVFSCVAPKNSSRRYQYLSHGSFIPSYNIRRMTRHGINQGTCVTKFTYDKRYMGKDNNACDVCLCTCDDNPSPHADSKINIRPVTADEDHVITGLRWVKRHHTLYIQIEQGMIGTRGDIDPDSIEWKDIEEPRDEKDIARIAFKGINGFLLGDLQLEEGKVMTGIKFEIVENRNAKLVTFRLLGTPYEYKTGKLLYSNDDETPFYDDPDGSLSSNIWDSPIKLPDSFSDSEKVDLSPYKVNVDATEPSVFADSSKKYVQFDTSHFDSDAGQNTIPFFEMQDNVQYPAFPLAGVGIYFTKKENHAGFLSLKLFSFDNSPYLVEKFES